MAVKKMYALKDSRTGAAIINDAGKEIVYPFSRYAKQMAARIDYAVVKKVEVEEAKE
jgi:hypothetical protein